MRANSEAGVEEEDAAVSPGGEETAFVGWCSEVGIIVFERFVDVHEGGRSRGGRANGEGKAVGLVDVVVGVLADYDGFDGVEGRVTGPG